MDFYNNNFISEKILRRLLTGYDFNRIVSFDASPLNTIKKIVKDKEDCLIELSFFISQDIIIEDNNLKDFIGTPLNWHSYLAYFKDGLVHLNISKSVCVLHSLNPLSLDIDGVPLTANLSSIISPPGKNFQNFSSNNFSKIINPT